MVMVEVPVGVDELVVSVRVELLPAVTEDGLKLALAPEGSPPALKLTV